MCSSEAPDTRLQQEAAMKGQELSAEQLAWMKEIYAETAPARARAEQRATTVSDAQLGSMRLADARAQDYSDYEKSTFRPVEQRLVSDAMGYDTPGRRETEAGQAMADVDTQIGAARDTAMREQAARGVDPSSGSSAIALSRGAIAGGAFRAAAGNQARKQVETMGAAKLSDAANLGRNIASSQATNAGIALNAGNASVANAGAAATAGQSGQAAVQQAYGGAQSGLASAGSQFGSISNAKAANDASNTAATNAAVGSAAGLAAAFFLSDEKEKTDRKPASDEGAMKAVRDTPVESWQYKDDSVAADGGKTHVGPMAQDVQKTMGDAVAPGGKAIDPVSANGVTLAAVKNIDKRLRKLEAKPRIALTNARR